jgi:cytochrome c biogenesis protein ResB
MDIMLDHIEWVIGGLVAVVVGLVMWLVVADNAYWKQCEAEGGRKVAVGTHVQTHMVMVGKVMVPQTIVMTDYSCQK